MTQKVLKVGSSAAVTVPKEALKAIGAKIGDGVTTEAYPELGIFVVSSPNNKKKELFDIAVWTQKFIKEYGPALKALARK